MAQNLVERVLKTIRNYEMLTPGDSVLVAVSGGPDSVFLLYAMDRLKNKLKIKKLVVCNLDHGLRGPESRADSLFVKKISGEMGLELVHKKIDLNKSGLKNLSTEEAAREARYRFFRDAAKKSHANIIATGHTLDDQAETILMRLVKGSSLKGIVGISPVREEGMLHIIRPLIELEKGEIVKYLDAAKIPYRTDRTNLEPIYFRNVVRSQIIPFLERYNPRLKRVLFNLAEHLREDFEFIYRERLKARRYMFKGGEEIIEISLKDIAVQPRAIQKEILRDSLDKVGGEVKKLSFRHWKEMEGLIKHKRKGSSVDLPGGIRVSRTARELVFRRI